ncbi:MAG: hypothetical protein MK161_03995 [Pirellulales bacterium]|nr:hypothetical protein [Pirellulales bacterium]
MAKFPIHVDVGQPRVPRSRRKQHQRMTVVAVLGVLALALLWIGRSLLRSGAEDRAQSVSAHATNPVDSQVTGRPSETSGLSPPNQPLSERQAVPQTIADDGQTLWISPTSGKPVDLAFLPPGCQIFFALRPADLLRHPEGEKVLAAVGPLAEPATGFITQTAGIQLAQMAQLVIGLRVLPGGDWDATMVIHPVEVSGLKEVVSSFSGGMVQKHAGESYAVRDRWACYVPATGKADRIVMTAAKNMAEVLDLEGQPPPLRRDLEQLVEATDSDRMMTLVVAPNYLWSEGKSLFSGPLARLEKPLIWFTGEGLTALGISLHWDENFFMELFAAATIDTAEHILAKRFSERIAQLPAGIEDYVFQLELQPYGRRLLARLPEMVRALTRYTRSGHEEGYALVRCYLPPEAGQNLLLATELSLVEPLRQVTAIAAPKASATGSLEARFNQVTSLSFSQDTLEAALETLSQEIGVEIVILGTDLQLAGITKNQSFGLDEQNRPGGEILLEILKLANPDKSSTSLTDPRQKLVYVVKPLQSGGTPGIAVTTREAATRRGDRLPDVFHGEP